MTRSGKGLAVGVAAVFAAVVGAIFAGTDLAAHPRAAATVEAAPLPDDCQLVGVTRSGNNLIECDATAPTDATSTTAEASTTTLAPTTTTTRSTTTSSAPTTTSTTTSSTTSTTQPPTTTTPPRGGFTEGFDTGAALARFDFQLRTYGPSVVASTFRGEHDDGCHGPDTYRTIRGSQAATGFMDVSATGLVYHCGGAVANGHMMTALSTPGIAILAFSPKQTFTDVTTICWDQNANNLGGGKWANVLVVPAGDVTARGGNLAYTAALANGIGDAQFRQPPPASAYDFTWLTGSVYSQGVEVAWKSYVPGGMDASPAARHQICLRDRGATIEVHRPDQTVDTYKVGARFPAGPVRVIWQDATYDAAKHGGSDDHLTWHWDNIVIGAAA